jgi:hypothetical protein
VSHRTSDLNLLGELLDKHGDDLTDLENEAGQAAMALT